MLSRSEILYSKLKLEPFTLLNKTKETNLNIACILEEDLYKPLSYDANLHPINAENWSAILITLDIDLLLVQPTTQASELLPLVSRECKTKNIPITLWDTTDNSQIDRINIELDYFDLVCAADSINYNRYKSQFKGRSLYLPVSIQPKIYNPYLLWPDKKKNLGVFLDGIAELITKPDNFSFLDAISNFNPRVVDSRYQHSKKEINSAGTNKKYVSGYLDHERFISALKHFNILIMFDWSKSSRITQQQEVIRAVACGLTILYIGDIERLGWTAKYVTHIHNSQALTPSTCNSLLSPTSKTESVSHQNIREIFNEHTIAERLETIANFFNLQSGRIKYPKVSLITASNRPSYAEKALETFKKQTYPNKEFLFIMNLDSGFDKAKLQTKFSKVPDVQFFNFSTECSIGKCLNFGLDKSSGEFCMKVDDDDIYSENYVLDMILATKAVDSELYGLSPTYRYYESTQSTYQKANCKKFQNIVFNGQELNGRVMLSGATISGKRDPMRKLRFLETHRGNVDSLFIHHAEDLNYRLTFMANYGFIIFRSSDPNFHTWRVVQNEHQNLDFLCDGISEDIIC